MKTIRSISGFSLVEITIALGITAFCLLALFGLIPVGISSNRASVTESGAANIATGLIGDLQVTQITNPPTAQKSPQFNINIPSAGSETHTLFFRADGTITGTVDSDADPKLNPFYRAMFVIKPDSTAASKATSVRMLITWPALGDRKQGATPVNFTGSFETVVALNRN